MNTKLKTIEKVDVLTVDGKISSHVTSNIDAVIISGKGEERKIKIIGQLNYTRSIVNESLSFNDTISRKKLSIEQKSVYDNFCNLIDELHLGRKSTTDYNLQPV